jgi:hypothetical protein
LRRDLKPIHLKVSYHLALEHERKVATEKPKYTHTLLTYTVG